MRISDWSSDVCSSDLRKRDQPVVALDRVVGTFPGVDPAVVLPRIDDHPVIDAQPGDIRARIETIERRQRRQPEKEAQDHVSRHPRNRAAPSPAARTPQPRPPTTPLYATFIQNTPPPHPPPSQAPDNS